MIYLVNECYCWFKVPSRYKMIQVVSQFVLGLLISIFGGNVKYDKQFEGHTPAIDGTWSETHRPSTTFITWIFQKIVCKCNRRMTWDGQMWIKTIQCIPSTCHLPATNQQPLPSAWSACIIVPSRSTQDGMLSLTRVTCGFFIKGKGWLGRKVNPNTRFILPVTCQMLKWRWIRLGDTLKSINLGHPEVDSSQANMFSSQVWLGGL